MVYRLGFPRSAVLQRQTLFEAWPPSVRPISTSTWRWSPITPSPASAVPGRLRLRRLLGPARPARVDLAVELEFAAPLAAVNEWSDNRNHLRDHLIRVSLLVIMRPRIGGAPASSSRWLPPCSSPRTCSMRTCGCTSAALASGSGQLAHQPLACCDRRRPGASRPGRSPDHMRDGRSTAKGGRNFGMLLPW